MVSCMASELTQIADKTRGIASEKRVNQEEIARVLGLSRQAVNLRMNGRVPFAAWEIKRLSQEFGVPVSAFFGDAPSPEVRVE